MQSKVHPSIRQDMYQHAWVFYIKAVTKKELNKDIHALLIELYDWHKYSFVRDPLKPYEARETAIQMFPELVNYPPNANFEVRYKFLTETIKYLKMKNHVEVRNNPFFNVNL